MKYSHLLLVCVAGFAACRSNTTSPQMTGTIAGRVMLFDSSYAALKDFTGATVQIAGTDRSATTAADGSWQIDNLEEGSYDIVASKPGFGTYHWYEQIVTHGRLDEPTAGIARMTSFVPLLDSVIWTGQFLYAFANKNTVPGNSGVVLYYDLSPNVQPSDLHLIVEPFADQHAATTYNALLGAGARPGQTIYVSASSAFTGNGYNIGCMLSYPDPRHNDNRCYASTGPKSNVIAVTMP